MTKILLMLALVASLAAGNAKTCSTPPYSGSHAVTVCENDPRDFIFNGKNYQCSGYASGGWGVQQAVGIDCEASSLETATRTHMHKGPDGNTYGCYFDCVEKRTEAGCSGTLVATLRASPKYCNENTNVPGGRFSGTVDQCAALVDQHCPWKLKFNYKEGVCQCTNQCPKEAYSGSGNKIYTLECSSTADCLTITGTHAGKFRSSTTYKSRPLWCRSDGTVVIRYASTSEGIWDWCRSTNCAVTGTCNGSGGRLAYSSDSDAGQAPRAGAAGVWGGSAPNVLYGCVAKYYWVTKGRHGGDARCDIDDCSTQFELDSKVHGVRCCGDGTSRFGKMKKNEGCSVYGASRMSPYNACQSPKTVSYSVALGVCQRAGARLCTIQELKGNCAASTGCYLDFRTVWSADNDPNLNHSPATTIPTLKPSSRHTQKLHYAVPRFHTRSMFPCTEADGSCDPVLTMNQDVHAVSCCKNTPDHMWFRHPMIPRCKMVWSASGQGLKHNDQCTKGSWYEAKHVCEANGARLCSRQELDAGCAMNTGCQFDGLLNWSNDS